ncbi:chromosomal replication initiator protein DnaA [bacterium]|nr:MAG: chromosomal replication initiator protein DnaA [bacterium]
MDLSTIWKKTQTQLEIRLEPSTYNRFFKYTELKKIDEGTAIIGTHSTFSSNILQTKHKKTISDLLSINYGKLLKVKFEVDPDMVDLATKDRSTLLVDELPIFQTNANPDLTAKLGYCNLNSKFTFDNFIVGDSNRLAHAAATSILNKKNRFNPFFIYGKTGLGKTHLVQAIGISFLEKDLSKKVLYVPSETFLNDLVRSIRTQTTLDFRKKYRELDLLIIDDIQLISKWVETQNEFFNTFNVLNLSDKQVILISDRPPEEIQNLEDRLKSRFQGGLSVSISEPELETRYAILLQKQKDLETNLRNEILRDIARIVTTNIRELEGALTKVNLMQSLKDSDLTSEEVASILGKEHSERKIANPNDVLRIIGAEYGVSLQELKSERRTANIAFARQIAMYIFAIELGFKLEKIAEILKRKDHTTVLHGRNKIETQMKMDAGLRSRIEKITNQVFYN